MHILFVLGGLRIGGYEILSVRMANELAKRNCRVGIVSASKDAHILEMLSQDVETYSVAREFKFDLTILPKIMMIISDFKPDIILTCSFFTYYLVKAATLLSFRKRKIILAFHVTEPFGRSEDKWMHIYSILAKYFDDEYVAIYDSQIDFYSSEYGLPRNRFFVIHNGVDTGYFEPRTNDGAKNDSFLRIAHVASLKPVKDQWTLLKSMVELNKANNAWDLRIAGADPSGMLNRFQEYVREHNMSSKVKFLGPVSDIRDVLKDSDVFVLTSITEALPLSVIEAMAMGLPCIATDVGGISVIITNGEEGFIVPVGDYIAIAKHLEYLLRNPIKRKQMSVAARKKIEKEFNFGIMVNQYYSLFEKLIDK